MTASYPVTSQRDFNIFLQRGLDTIGGGGGGSPDLGTPIYIAAPDTISKMIVLKITM